MMGLQEWEELFAGYYATASYKEAQRAENLLESSLKRFETCLGDLGIVI